jgi:hypothetical protein
VPIIRPVSLVSPPPAQTLADITAAIAVLNTHALIIELAEMLEFSATGPNPTAMPSLSP